MKPKILLYLVATAMFGFSGLIAGLKFDSMQASFAVWYFGAGMCLLSVFIIFETRNKD